MSKTNNLGDFLTDIADTIRTKKGTSATINAQDFSSEIAGIQTGTDVSDTTATASDVLSGKDFYNANGVKTSGTIQDFVPTEVTENGTLATAGKRVTTDIVVNVPSQEPTLQAKSVTVTQNGDSTITADSGYDGLSSVALTVNVSGGGGGGGADTQQLTDLIEGDIVNLTIPSGTTKIRDSAFSAISRLKTVNIPSSVTSLGSGAFTRSGITTLDLSNITALPSGYLGQNMCRYCTSLTSVILSAAVLNTNDETFNGCTILGNITLPSRLQTIGQRAFMNCSAFTEVTIPSTVTSIGVEAYYGCSRVTTIKVLANTPPQIQARTFSNMTALTRVEVPSASLSAYQNATNWSSLASKMVGV